METQGSGSQMPKHYDSRWRAQHLFYHGDMDVALRHCVRPAISRLLSCSYIDRFFFIRYNLGGPHIRIRYRLTSESTQFSSHVDEVLAEHVSVFLRNWPSSKTLDEESIRQESRSILASVPEESNLYYPDGSFLPFPFEPEVDRYGGPGLLPHSLDFFAVSSLQALEAIKSPMWPVSGHRGALVFSLLFRQAAGFASSEEELLLHLGYRLPVGQRMGDQIWSKADADFEARPGSYRQLIKQELSRLEMATRTTVAPIAPEGPFLYEASRSLSRAVAAEADKTRWQIGHSQLHMTANRLGFSPQQEMHIQRLLWRSAHSIKESDKKTWKTLIDSIIGPSAPCCSMLSSLLDSVCHCIMCDVEGGVLQLERI